MNFEKYKLVTGARIIFKKKVCKIEAFEVVEEESKR